MNCVFMYRSDIYDQRTNAMKKTKLSYFLLISLLVIVTALTSFALVACNQHEDTPITGPEAGVYYYDAGADEYTVVLGEGTQFTLAISDVSIAGKYSLNGDVLTLTSNKQGENQISAILKNDIITLTFNDAEYRFLKKTNFTVTFNSNEGSSVNSATVLNGKKVAKPADPTKEGFVFVGWYADSEFKTSFAFNSQTITADTTVYARWVEKQVGGLEFVAEFDADNGENNPDSMTTIGGKLFNLPVVERDGYTFKGWWYSMSGDDKLSYEFSDGMSLDANTTLHAVWQSNNLGTKLAAPLVNVDANSVKWNSVGAREYQLKVQGPDGNYIVNKSLGGTVEGITFENYPAGEYIVTVTAVANTGEENNSVTTRVYKNKAIARVSQFSVIEPSILLYNAVENAERYLITIDCGDKNHNHVNFDNGQSTHFNFSDCMMQDGGIKFTVTAVANGYASSVSAQYVYAPVLDAVTEFDFNEQTQKLVWNEVDNATGYMVSVKCGNSVYGEEFFNVGKVNSISLKECAKVDGGIIVKVYPVSKLYISPETATFTFNKQNLATPSNIRIQGTTVSWDAVQGATSYEVSIAGTTVSSQTNSVDLAGKVNLTEKQSYALTVVAKGAQDSLPTDPIDARNLAMANALKYENSVLSWTHVIGAAFYDVQINDEAAFSVSDGSNFAQINLTKAGENILKVRFVDETGSAYEWVSTSVYAHTLTFVSDGGYSVEEQYKAVGDAITLPTPQKTGYNFLNWYNTPKGPESNGAAYIDNTFRAAGDLVLYACYTPKEYTVTYHYGDGGNGVQVNDGVYYQKDYQLTVPQANEATSAFGGWFSAPNGNGIQYTDDKGNSLNPWNRTENADVYAFWFDDVLSFTSTTNAGRPVYAVMQGSRISQVTEVTVPETYKGVKVGMLSGNAFKDCSNLVTINIPNTLEVISSVDPFTGCTSLQAINVYEVENNRSIRYWSSDGVLFDNGRLDQQPADPSQIRSQLSFMPLGKTGSYTIPDGIVEIPTLAFANCALSRVVIPSSVTTIGMNAFKGSEQLTSIVFDTGSKTALTIGDSAFADCTALVNVTLPARLTSIGLTRYELLKATGTPASQEVSLTTGVTNAFVGCKELKNIYVANGSSSYKSVDGILYSADGTTLLYCLPSVTGDAKTGTFEIPAGVSTIANGAFIDSKIKNIVIPSTVTMVGECAFYDADITSITFKGNGFNDVTIGKYAFRACEELKSVTFEDGNRVSVIGEGAFFGCDNYGFNSIELPKNLKSIGAQAFRDCEKIKEIVISANDDKLVFGSDVFYNCKSLATLTLPKNVSELPGVFSGCTSLKEVIVDPENPYFTSIDGVLYDKAQTIILFYPQNKSNSSFVIPESVTTISDGVFRGNKNLKSVTIGKNVSKIGDGAFMECRYLSEIIFAAGDNGAASLEIGAYAFYKCGNSSYSKFSVELPARTTKAGEYAFAEMSYLSAITLNEGLEEISDYMLYYDERITAINIPASVKTIGEEAFYYCGSYDYEFSVTFAADSQLVSIGNSAFASTYGYDFTLELPTGLQHIGYKAFYSAKFAGYTIPNTVKTICAEAFASNSYLTNVTFAAGGTDDLILGAQYISDYGTVYEGQVFYSCSKIESVELPERTTFIGNSTFERCSKLTSVTFGENSRLKHIGEEVFYGTELVSLTVPKSVSNGNVTIDENGTSEFRIGVGNKAFSGISTLTALNFEEGGTEPLSFGDGAFNYLNNLTTLNLPARICDYEDSDGNTVRGISVRSFSSVYSNGTSDGQSTSSQLTDINIEEGGAYYCSVNGVVYTADKTVLVLCPVNKTGEVTVEVTVTEIEVQAFKNAKITSIKFGTSKADMVIGKEAFAKCNSLEEVVLPDNVVEINEGAFSSCDSLARITLPANLKEFNSNILTGTNIQQINISENNPDYGSQNGVVFSKDMKTLILYPSTLKDKSYTVPAGVTTIGDNAFKGNTAIETIVLPTGLKKIGASAFSGCSSLKNVEFPNTLEIIGNNAFNQCSSLGEITFEKNAAVSLVVEDYAFQTSGITKVELPVNLTALGSQAFSGCAYLSELTFATGCRLDSMGDNVFSGCKALTKVDLPQGLTKIGDRVFDNCSGLVSVTFGEGLTEIGQYTFTKCSNLVSVEFPASLKTMGVGTFSDNAGYGGVYCTSLKSVTFAQGSQLTMIPEGTFYKCTALERFTIPASVTYIESRLSSDYGFEAYHFGAFQDCASLKSVTFEEGSRCKEIGASAFLGCVKLEMFAIPASVSTLGASAFEKCEALVEIVIPSTATIYGNYLFNGCTSLERVSLNEKATALSDGMFYNCTSLKHLNIPASVTKFGSSLLYNTGIETFVVPSNITELPYSFLSGCKSLVSVELPSGLKKIGRSSFSGCTALRTIDIPAGVTAIGDSAFSGCAALIGIELPENLETIGEYAFESCALFTNLTIPSKVTNIGKNAFYGCSGLTSVTIGSRVASIGSSAFENCFKLVEVYNNSSLNIVVGDAENGAVAYYAEAVLTAGQDSIITTTEDGFVLCTSGANVKVLSYTGSKTQIVLPSNVMAIYEYAFSGSNITSVIIPASVTSITDYAFYGCPELVSVTIQGQIDKIGKYAFYDCAKLETVVMQGQVGEIGQSAFENCVKLTSINLPDSITKIGNSAFRNCKSLENITLPADLITLGSSAFRECSSLLSIVIPDAVSSLNSSTFQDCTSLRTVKLPTSLDYLSSDVFKNCSSLESYAMDGDGNSKYKITDGVLFNAEGTKLISVPAMKTGTFVVTKEVEDIADNAFAGSHLNLLMFEGGRSSKFYLSSAYYGGAWLANATVKAIVISTESFDYINSYVFDSWTSEQTICFVESEAVISEKLCDMSRHRPPEVNIEYDYQVPQEETTQE